MVIRNALLFFAVVVHTQAYALENALYAQIHGVHNGHYMQVFKGAHKWAPVSYKAWIKNIFCANPHILYFDKQGQVIKKEMLTLPKNKAHQEKYMHNLLDGTRENLTHMSAVTAVDAIAFKAPGWQYLKMYDKNGNCIVQTNMQYWGGLETGDVVSEKVISECGKLVSNPEELKKMHIRKAYNQNIITGKLHELQPSNIQAR